MIGQDDAPAEVESPDGCAAVEPPAASNPRNIAVLPRSWILIGCAGAIGGDAAGVGKPGGKEACSRPAAPPHSPWDGGHLLADHPRHQHLPAEPHPHPNTSCELS